MMCVGPGGKINIVNIIITYVTSIPSFFVFFPEVFLSFSGLKPLRID